MVHTIQKRKNFNANLGYDVKTTNVVEQDKAKNILMEK